MQLPNLIKQINTALTLPVNRWTHDYEIWHQQTTDTVYWLYGAKHTL